MILLCEEIENLVKSVVQNPEQVVVSEVRGFPSACEIQVLEVDYEKVMKKIPAIKTLAARFSGLPEGQDLTIHVIPVASGS